MAKLEANQPKRKRVDPNTLTPEEREKYEAARAPKPAFLVYKIVDGKVDVHSATRSADEALAAIDEDRELVYLRFKIK